MGGKKAPAKSETLSLDESEPSVEVPKAKKADKKGGSPSKSTKKSTKPAAKKDDFEPPAHWGPQGSGGYLAFHQARAKLLKEQLGSEYDNKAEMKVSGELYAQLDDQEKWEKYGGKPKVEKPQYDGPRGNFLVFHAFYKKQ